MTSRPRAAAALVLLMLAPLAAGCTTMTGGLAPSASVTTAIQGWENWLAVEWTTQARPGGQDIDGFVRSLKGAPIVDLQLLAQGLDASGNVVSQRIARLPFGVPPLQSAPFRIAAMPPAERYRVTVWAFESVESPSGWD